MGERLSALYLAALLKDRGQPAAYVDLSNVIDFRSTPSTDPIYFQRIAEIVGTKVRACGSKVPVITGYFGQVEGGLLKTVSRGYSDLLAALVAVGIDAKELQVWKEVSGVYTADPRKVPTATLIPSITPLETNELTFFGS